MTASNLLMESKVLCPLKWFSPPLVWYFTYKNEITMMPIILKCLRIKTVLSILRLLIELFHGGIPSGKLECIFKNCREAVIWNRRYQHLFRVSFTCRLSLAAAKLKVCLYVWYITLWRYIILCIYLLFLSDHHATIRSSLIGLWSENSLFQSL